MTRYRNCWLTATALVCTIGIYAAVLTWTTAGVLTTFAYSAVVGSALTGAVQREEVRRRWRQVVWRGAAIGAAVVGMLGIAFLLDGVALLVLLLVLGSSPPIVRGAVRLLRQRQGTTRTTRTAPRGATSALSDVELCLAWCRSYAELQQPQSPTSRLRVVQERQQYLDELERRNRAGLLAWLAAGAEPTDDPRRYIETGRRGEAPRDE